MPDPVNRRASYRCFLAIPTRWMDNDTYGHVNNVSFYSYFDTAVNHYLIEQDVLDIERSPVIGLVVETACQYFAPIAFPDIAHVGLRVGKLGTRQADDRWPLGRDVALERRLLDEAGEARGWRGGVRGRGHAVRFDS